MVNKQISQKTPHASQDDRITVLLRNAGLRPTRQRCALAELLFDHCHKHVTAEQLHAAVRGKRASIALATVYNTLNQFVEAGLLRQVIIDPGRVYFDTNIDSHHHFFDSRSGHLEDVAADDVRIARLPDAPQGRDIERVDVIIRLR